jgi:hypothetical protein
MARLANAEDPQLRFLLGYIEYHTGNELSGLEHLTRAAAAAAPGSVIARYPGMLKGDGTLPPPKLPDLTPPPPPPPGISPEDAPAPAPAPAAAPLTPKAGPR